MSDKQHIESVLKVNGLSASSSDEEIRSLLLNARFTQEEVEVAIKMLKSNVKTNEVHVDGLHKVFRTDTTLHPAEVSRLLGVELHIREEIATKKIPGQLSLVEFVLLIVLSLLTASAAMVGYMYSQKIGFFHPSAEVGSDLSKSK